MELGDNESGEGTNTPDIGVERKKNPTPGGSIDRAKLYHTPTQHTSQVRRATLKISPQGEIQERAWFTSAEKLVYKFSATVQSALVE